MPETLDLSRLCTIRAGEQAYDQPLGRVLPLAQEIIKIKGRGDGRSAGLGGWACVFYDGRARACRIHENRPAECVALLCEDTRALSAIYHQNRLTRAALLGENHPALTVMAEHEALVPIGRIGELGAALRSGAEDCAEAARELVIIAETDATFRRLFAERIGIGPEYHDFFLGRGAAALFSGAGVALRTDVRTGLRVQPDPLWRTR